jgi:hypothetical protein
MSHTIRDLICSELDLVFRSSKFYQVLQTLCQYIVGTKGAFEFQSDLQAIVDFTELPISAKDFRLKLLALNKSQIGLKFYTLNIIRYNVNKEDIKQLSLRCGLDKKDGLAVYIVMNPIRHKLRRNDYIKTLDKDLIDPANIPKLEQLFVSLYSKMLATVRQIAYTRLRFCSTSTNQELKDFHSDLMMKAVQAFYRLVPTTQSDAYILNYLRRSISNDAKNMIKKYTSKKNGRLIGTGKDQFGANRSELIVISENQLNIRQEDDESVSYDQLMAWDITVDSLNTSEIEFSIQQILEKYSHLRNKSRALRILLGQEDQEFTDWLKTKHIIKQDQDNLDLQDKLCPEDFQDVVATYLNVDKPQLGAFISKIKSQFGHHASTKSKVG